MNTLLIPYNRLWFLLLKLLWWFIYNFYNTYFILFWIILRLITVSLFSIWNNKDLEKNDRFPFAMYPTVSHTVFCKKHPLNKGWNELVCSFLIVPVTMLYSFWQKINWTPRNSRMWFFTYLGTQQIQELWNFCLSTDFC